MNSPKAMPKGPAPFSRADIEIVKKISAPTANGSSHGSKAFSVPKAVPKGGNNNRLQHKRYEDDDEDDDEGKRSVISDEEKHGNKDDEDDIDDDSDHFVVREKLSSERSVKHTVTSTSSYKLPPAEDNVRKDSSNNNNEGESSLESSNPPSPAGEVVFNFRPLLKATYRVLRDFVLSPAAKGVITRCYIERTLKAAEFFVPRYSLCADLEDGTGRELIVCRKIMTSRTPHYVFSLKDEDLYKARDKRSRLYLGKLRALPSQSISSRDGALEYVLYDSGSLEPIENGSSTKSESSSGRSYEVDESTSMKYGNLNGTGDSGGENLYRRELVAIVIHKKSRPAGAGTRPMEVCIPTPLEQPPQASQSPRQPQLYTLIKPFAKTIASQSQNGASRSAITIMHERVSRYDPLSACLVDLKGRANAGSIKNYQLVVSYPETLPFDEDMESHLSFVLQMGKTTSNCFNMDYKAPLSMLQAFAICVARMDANLQWEK